MTDTKQRGRGRPRSGPSKQMTQKCITKLKSMGYTQYEIGEIAGVTGSAVTYWVEGKAVPRVRSFEALREAAGL